MFINAYMLFKLGEQTMREKRYTDRDRDVFGAKLTLIAILFILFSLFYSWGLV